MAEGKVEPATAHVTPFSKVLAKYYRGWHKDCLESVKFCESKGQTKLAEIYRQDAESYAKLIAENEEAIEFFSQGDNAFLLDGALPEKWRGYK